MAYEILIWVYTLTQWRIEKLNVNTIFADHWKAKVESYRNWFLEQEEARSDESKRSDGTAKNSSVLFGIEGSFRKLEVD